MPEEAPGPSSAPAAEGTAPAQDGDVAMHAGSSSSEGGSDGSSDAPGQPRKRRRVDDEDRRQLAHLVTPGGSPFSAAHPREMRINLVVHAMAALGG